METFRQPGEVPAMRLHMLSRSFEYVPGRGDASATAAAMDAQVWSRLPDGILWRVLGLLPAAKRFQLHLVSRKWRQVLTSPHFRNTIAAAVPAAAVEQRVVVACLNELESVDEAMKGLKVVDVDLSFVPTSFWDAHRKGCAVYSVVAVGHGLLCIHNHLMCLCRPERPAGDAGTGYCVLNPVTRTCVVLPPAPLGRPAAFGRFRWLPLSAAGALTMCRWDDQGWEVATCDPAAAGPGEGPYWTVLRSPMPVPGLRDSPPVLAHCCGDTFWYHAGRVHVLAPPPTEAAAGAKRRRLEEAGVAVGGGSSSWSRFVEAADAVDGPSVALLGLDPASIGYQDDRVFLVPHGGAVFLVAHLMRRDAAAVAGGGGSVQSYTWDPELAAGVWRLARHAGRMAWEPVSRLDAHQAKRLVEIGPASQDGASRPPLADGNVTVCGAFMVRDWLCCDITILTRGEALLPPTPLLTAFVLAFDFDAAAWAPFVTDKRVEFWELAAGRRKCGSPVELRPDLFLVDHKTTTL